MKQKIAIAFVLFCSILVSATAVTGLGQTSNVPSALTDRGITVDYTVYDGSDWVEYLERPVGTDLEFKVEVTDAVGLVFTLTVVLPEALTYTGDANPPPNDTSGNDLNGTNLYWSYETAGGSRTVTFHATVAQEGTSESLAVGVILLPPVSDSDSINITGTGSDNLPPDVPEKPSGETTGKIDTSYIYSTVTSDPNGDQVYYQWKWGDGQISEWFGPFDSDTTHEADHSWDKRGSYDIQVRSKDIYNATSDWSDPLPVKMPHVSIFSFLERLLDRFPILQYFFPAL